MNSSIARAPGCRRLLLIVAGVLALLGSLAVTAPAQAGYYGDGYYPRPCADRCGYYAPRRYYAPRYYGGCSSCGCVRRCYSGASRSRYYERRYVEREYVERGYGAPRRHHGYYPSGGYRPYARSYPWGYGGVRGWRAPYGYGYRPAAETYGDGYEEAPRPPAPVWGGGGYEAEPEADGY